LLDLPSMGKWFLEPSQLVGFGGLVTDPVHGLGIPFMLAGPILTVFCLVVYVVTSLLTPAMNETEVEKVCWDHPLAFLKGPVHAASDPRVISLLLLVTVCACYVLFR
jgi:hypothetical protein